MGHFLIVDDEPDDRTLVARALRAGSPDTRITEVASRADWERALALGDHDVVFTDYRLNWTDGLTILREARSGRPFQPVVFVTDSGDEGIAATAMEAGLDDYIIKRPERLKKLPVVARAVMERARVRRAEAAERADLTTKQAERSRVTGEFSGLATLETPEQTAVAICEAVASALQVEFVGLTWFVQDGALALAIRAPMVGPVQGGGLLPADRAAYLLDRAARGPWIEDFRETSDPYRTAWRHAGVALAVSAPIVRDSRAVGVIAFGSQPDWSVEQAATRLPFLMEFAALSGPLLGPAMATRTATNDRATALERVIRDGAFHAVFQPIVGLAANNVIAYEGVTRFTDGTPTGDRFRAAVSAGLGSRLEAATVARVLSEARGLPAGATVNVNASPHALLDGTIEALVRSVDRPITVELSEREAVEDYAALRAAIKRLGSGTTMAVDDAGAGFASLRHILELRPTFVKLDPLLVRGVDRDAPRQALVAGMVHFARETGIALIAEGVELAVEARTLRRLGISLGQGFLFGRPAPAETWRAGAGRPRAE